MKKWVIEKLEDAWELIFCKAVIEPILGGRYPLRYRISDWIKKKFKFKK